MQENKEIKGVNVLRKKKRITYDEEIARVNKARGDQEGVGS